MKENVKAIKDNKFNSLPLVFIMTKQLEVRGLIEHSGTPEFQMDMK